MCLLYVFVFFFKQKTAYEMRISDWSSDVCSSDLKSLLLTDCCHSRQSTQAPIHSTESRIRAQMASHGTFSVGSWITRCRGGRKTRQMPTRQWRDRKSVV